MEQVSAFLQLIAAAVISTAVPIVTTQVILWAANKLKEVKLSRSAKEQAAIDWAVDLAVKAAEQSGLADLIANTAKAKKNEAVKVATDALKRLGITLSDAELSAQIEAAILQGWQDAKDVLDGEPTEAVGFRL